ncbi:MAG: hypothetical protein AAF797_08310 [Planctomycetota bacterium]
MHRPVRSLVSIFMLATLTLPACHRVEYVTDPSAPYRRLQLVACSPAEVPASIQAAFRESHPKATDFQTYRRHWEKGLGNLGSGGVRDGWSIRFTAAGKEQLWHYPPGLPTGPYPPTASPSTQRRPVNLIEH